MSATVLRIRRPFQTSRHGILASRLRAMGASAYALIREWRRRARSRLELASYSREERKDLGFAANLDAEIAKPFWRK